MGDARVFGVHIHQDVAAVVFFGRVDHQVNFHVLRIADDHDGVEIDAGHHLEAQQMIERDRAFGVFYPDTGVVDTFNIDIRGDDLPSDGLKVRV